ncbi:DUF397 domain-containing protein [Streptomyces axinellae]|uniref:DUF397 domain-containing protein n=1 Tax=Streptomyces axinellae TaxID=552788 RepID=A0ABP6CYC9_9ACTN
MTDSQWIKSSYSGPSGGQCLEWAPAVAATGSVPVRDSKDASRAPLRFSTAAWKSFVAEVKH